MGVETLLIMSDTQWTFLVGVFVCLGFPVLFLAMLSGTRDLSSLTRD